MPNVPLGSAVSVGVLEELTLAGISVGGEFQCIGALSNTA
jgi:hypothetical protein